MEAKDSESIMPIAIGITKDKNKLCQMPFVVSPSASLRTGLSNHEWPFDRLRANGRKPIFV